MKLSKLLIGLLLLGSCQTPEKQSVINGNVKNTSDDAVFINFPIEGKFFSGNSHVITPDSTGNYTFTFPLETTGVAFVSNNFTSTGIFVENNHEYSVSFEGKNPTKITYNSQSEKNSNLLRELELFANSRNTVDPKDTDFQTKSNYYTQLLNEKVALLDKAQNEKLISRKAYQKLKNLTEIKMLDYLATDCFFTFRLFYEETPEKHSEFAQKYVAEWEKAYLKAFENPDFSAYDGQGSMLSQYVMMQDIKRTGTLQFAQSDEPYLIGHIRFLKENAPAKILEYGWANLIYNGLSFDNFEKDWITNFEEFKKQFPQSKLTELLAPEIAKIEEFHKEKSTEGIVFVENYSQINSLEELFATFGGKVAYIDLWATWCGPCRKELQYSKENHETIEQMGVLSVYLSIDQDNAHENWERMVKNLDLKGLHLRANASLKKEIEQFVRAIPHYIIVGKDGKIKVANAKRPSDKKELFDQLREFL